MELCYDVANIQCLHNRDKSLLLLEVGYRPPTMSLNRQQLKLNKMHDCVVVLLLYGYCNNNYIGLVIMDILEFAFKGFIGIGIGGN